MTSRKNTRRQFLKTLGMGCAAMAVSPHLAIGRPARKKPNVLFLFTDDQRFDTIGALNNPAIKTPNLDRLVKRGVSFTNAYIMGGYSGAV